MNLLSNNHREQMLKRFPNIKLSYETLAHKKVSSDYNVAVAIPYGIRAFIWFTFFENKKVCCICELTRHHVMGERIYFEDIPIPDDYELGTIVSGIFIEEPIHDFGDISSMSCSGASSSNSSSAAPSTSYASCGVATEEHVATKHRVFLLEDIFMLKGCALHARFQPSCYAEKIQHFVHFCKTMDEVCKTQYSSVYFSMPYMWKYEESLHPIDKLPIPPSQMCYDVKYIQYLSTSKILPLLNVPLYKKPVWNPVHTIEDDDAVKNNKKTIWTSKYVSPPVPQWNLCVHRHLYHKPCYFWVKADLAHDVYHLYAKRSKPSSGDILYQYAFVPNMKTSKMLNGIFRNMKEDHNLDAVEESEDEDDFENVQEDRFVDLQKRVLMECIFHKKFKKWIPTKVAEKYINGVKAVPYLDQLIVK